MRRFLGLSTAVMVFGLANLTGCAQKQDSAPAEGAMAQAPKTVFDMANGCFRLKANGNYVKTDGSGFTTAGSDAASAEHFFMHATGLGRYLFFSASGGILTGDRSAVTASATPADGSDWTFAAPGEGLYNAETFGVPLSVDGTGALVQADTPATLTFEPAQGCTAYPEMPLDIAPTYAGPAPGGRVIGFAEVHSHMGMGSEMSDGSGHVGPSAGGVMYGQAMNRFGVTEALKDCVNMHGPDGTLSPENIVLDQNPTEHHDTVGWPTFVDWPHSDSQLHQQMYYRWVERAYRAGLRTMTIHGTNIEALCDIATKSAPEGDHGADCIDMSVGEKQVRYMYDVEKYVDAQEGGPGKGWFRIVKDPAEARQVIADGKLAVIPGLEFSNLFHCNVTYNPDGSETDACTKNDIDAGVEEAWNLGVRQIFAYHDVDSALGGTGVFSSVLNEVGWWGTHGFWKMYACPDGGEGDTYFYPAGAVMESSSLTQFNDPITQFLIAAGAGKAPFYGPGRQCNARGVTDLGKYAIRKLMEKGFVMDIDHAELSIKQYMLDEGGKITPNYPMLSAHGGHGGLTNAQAIQMVRQGGVIYPALPNGQDYEKFVQQMKPIWKASGTTRPLAIGYGADSNGLRNLPGPRGAGFTPIKYPFTLFSGPGWGSQYGAAGIRPLQVDQLAIPGGRAWNPDEDGMSHYGLVPDIVEQIRIEGGEEATTALYNSAEAYLEMWEQTQQASAAARGGH